MKLGAKVTVLGLTLALTACGGKSAKEFLGISDEKGADDGGSGDDENKRPNPSDPAVQPDPLNLTAAMQTFASCAEAETYVEDQLVKNMHRDINRQIEWAKESNQGGDGGDVGVAEDSATPMADSNTSAEGAGADNKSTPDDFTTTNNQVEGVEESDHLKNDGTHIYHLAAGRLNILKSWPASEMAQIATFKFKGRMNEMLLGKDKLVLIGNPEYSEVPEKYKPEWLAQSEAANDSAYPYMQYAWDFVKVITVDISDKTKPKAIDTYMLKGSLNGSRRIGDAVRIVLVDYQYQPEGVKTWLDWQESQSMSIPARIASLEALKGKNETIIRDLTLEEWLHADAFTKVKAGVHTPALDLGDCTSIHAPTVDTELGLTRVATINLGTKSIHQTLLFTHASQFYSSQTGLYIATPYWWWHEEARNTDYTYIHKFDVSTADKAVYLGSGGVQGTLLNQFSMDEHNDVLRVATTITERLPDESRADEWWWSNWQTYNRVSTFKLEDDQLKKLGQTPNLAKDERIFAARFYGDRGFVVTFRQVDPLFTLDMSDPAAPKVVGELKIPGFSNYMQLIDENHILAIGQDANLEGRTQGLKLSMFDVSDMAKPKEIHSHVLDGSFWSEASWDHKAFTYFPARKVLGIPATGYDNTDGQYWYDRYRSTLLVFDIDVDAGISRRGSLEMNDIYVDNERPWSWWRQAARVSRSIFADDYVYAISNLGIRATALDSLETPVSTVRYECNDSCFNYWWW